MAQKYKKDESTIEKRSSQASGGTVGERLGESFGEQREFARNADPRNLRQEAEKLDAATEEEVDALRVNLLQEDENSSARDGSGLIVDEIAEEKVAKFTEVGPLSADIGAKSLTPGRDNTSSILRRHHPNTGVARAEDVVDGNLDEPREESRMERKVDEGTAA
jgi:hypothetical protein